MQIHLYDFKGKLTRKENVIDLRTALVLGYRDMVNRKLGYFPAHVFHVIDENDKLVWIGRRTDIKDWSNLLMEIQQLLTDPMTGRRNPCDNPEAYRDKKNPPRLYVGKEKTTGKKVIFYSLKIPTEETHGYLYSYAIGPFRTKKAAELMLPFGVMISTVAEAERIVSRKNPPRWRYRDRTDVEREGEFIDFRDYGGTDVTYFFKRDDGTIDLVSGSRLKLAHPIYEKKDKENPPLPASALMDLAVARSIVREVGSGQRELSDTEKATDMMLMATDKLHSSHKGQIDFENPPLIIPSLSQWHVYAGGTSAAPGKHAYDIEVNGIKWMIQPISNKIGYHIGYQLTVFGFPGASGYLWVSPDGSMNPHPGNIYTLFRRAESAAAMARKLHPADNPPLGVNPPLTEIYKNIIEIRAKKANGKLYRHPFGIGSGIYGLPDGSILIKSRRGKRLWKNFPKKGRK